jgi:hypothetical protein
MDVRENVHSRMYEDLQCLADTDSMAESDLSPSPPPAAPEQHHRIAQDQRTYVWLGDWLSEHRGDPAFKVMTYKFLHQLDTNKQSEFFATTQGTSSWASQRE